MPAKRVERVGSDAEEALAASCKICPELCAEVERQLEEKGKIFHGSINHKKIFQSIIRRYPDRVPHVSIEEFDGNTKRLKVRENSDDDHSGIHQVDKL